MHLYLGALEAGIVERKDIAVFVGRKHQRLLDGIGMQLVALQLGMRRVQCIVVYRCRELDDRRGVARYVLDRLRGGDLDVVPEFCRIKDVPNGVIGDCHLRAVDERDFAGGFA